MRRLIAQSALLPAPAEDLYATYLDPALHAAVTGAPVTVSAETGAPFLAFDGQISGTMLSVVAPGLIVQSWRSTNFRDDDPDSTLILAFVPEGKDGRIDLIHIDVPEQHNIAVAHLNSQGALADRTFFGDSSWYVPIGMASHGDHSVLLAAYGNKGPVLAQLEFGDSGTAAAPALCPGVANAASFHAGIVPGEVISLSGLGIGPEQGISSQPGTDGKAPVELAGVQVFFDEIAAPLLYVESQQINAFAPFELAARTTTTVRVVYNGQTAGPVDEPVGPGNPAVFRLSPGVSTQAAAINQDGTINGPAHPAPVGSVVTLFGTGFGQTQLPGLTGSIFPDVPSLLDYQVLVYVGDSYCPPPATVCSGGFSAEVLYAGAAPLEFAGVDQINFRVPPLNGMTGDAVRVSVQMQISEGTGIGGAVVSTISVR